MALPRITRQFLDGNLERPTGNQSLNRHILIIGTAEDGPVYEPVKIRDLTHAQEVFGRFGQGSLVRAIKEAIDAQAGSGGAPQISAVRIGEKFAQKAYLDLFDTNSNKVLTLQALYPGDIYNDISIAMDGSEIKIYNPKTEAFSIFTYDSNASNSLVDVHNVVELADAINADPNLNEILVADAIEKELHFEIEANAVDAVIESADDNQTTIDLSAALAADLVTGNRYLDGAANLSDTTDLSKTVVAIDKVYAISESGVKEYEVAGLTKIVTDELPLDGKQDSRFSTILNATDASGTLSQLANTAAGTVGSEAYLRHRNVDLGKVDIQGSTPPASYVINVDAPWGIAHEGTSWAAANDLPIVEAIRADLAGDGPALLKAVAPVATAKDAAEGWVFDTEKPFKLEYRRAGAAANDWQEVPISKSDGNFSLAWSNGTLTITLTDGTTNTPVTDLFNFANGGDLRISFDSVVGVMNEKSTLTSLQNTSAQFSDYFVRGNEILLGAPAPANLVFRHATVRYYELGSTLEIVDATAPKLKLIGSGIQPGAAGGKVDNINDVIIGLKYTITPDMFTLTIAKSLSGGTNGISLSNNQLYDELVEAYNRLDAYKFDIVVVPGAYLDSTKTGYNEITGLPQEVNAEFHLLMSNFLNSYNGEAVGIIGFKPLKGTGINGSITRLDVASRVEKLTEVDLSDPLRAANFLNPFDNKFMIAVDVEPIFIASGSPYTTTGEAWVAGHLATLQSNESIYLNEIPGAIGLRYAYSDKVKDGRSQLDALGDMRIIAAIQTASGVRLTDGPTLAKPGSDYERLTTLWIVKEAMGITRKVAGDYLGRPASLEILQALETRLKHELNNMVPNRLQAFTFKIKSSPKQRVLGQLEILLVLVPVFEIRDIKVPVILKADESALAQF